MVFHQLNIPVDLPVFKGAYGDLLILTLCKLITNGLSCNYYYLRCFSRLVPGCDGLVTLHALFVTIIRNMCPFFRQMCAVYSSNCASPSAVLLIFYILQESAAHFVGLLDIFAAPRIMYAKEKNYLNVVILLDAFNHVIHYQYSGTVQEPR